MMMDDLRIFQQQKYRTLFKNSWIKFWSQQDDCYSELFDFRKTKTNWSTVSLWCLYITCMQSFKCYTLWNYVGFLWKLKTIPGKSMVRCLSFNVVRTNRLRFFASSFDIFVVMKPLYSSFLQKLLSYHAEHFYKIRRTEILGIAVWFYENQAHILKIFDE